MGPVRDVPHPCPRVVNGRQVVNAVRTVGVAGAKEPQGVAVRGVQRVQHAVRVLQIAGHHAPPRTHKSIHRVTPPKVTRETCTHDEHAHGRARK